MNDLDPIAKYFWDLDISSLKWEQHRNFIVRRVLQYGDLQSLCWLRSRMGDEDLRIWIVTHNGSGLNPRQVRYWALILNIENPLADQWVKSACQTTWERRR
jgi:hypothetical protein